uniref:Tc1-like transposase DDE domain-containing protein n=1 Tax=Oncorhynchus tshawytscha TaxID=74940 RepID=A0AAZ3SRV7_ONCTS
MSAALMVPKNTVASFILKRKKYVTTKTLPRAGHLVKLGNWGRMALVTEVWPEFQASSQEETWHHSYGEAWWWHLRDKSLNGLEWPSQSPDLNPIKHLWRDLKIAVQQCSPSNLTELERICREEWEKLTKYRCAELVTSYPRRLEAVIAAKGASTKY